jgi:hypothetical protein
MFSFNHFPLQREEKYGQKAWPSVMGFVAVQPNGCESFIYFGGGS